MILNRSKDYYENDKERLREQARYKHRNLSEEEKTKRDNRYHNMSEEKKQRLKENQNDYREAKKSQFNNQYMIWKCMLWFMLTKHTDGDKSLIMHN